MPSGMKLKIFPERGNGYDWKMFPQRISNVSQEVMCVSKELNFYKKPSRPFIIVGPCLDFSEWHKDCFLGNLL